MLFTYPGCQKQGTYQLIREDERVILEGKIGQLASLQTNTAYLWLVLSQTMVLSSAIGKRSRLEAIEWLKQSSLTCLNKVNKRVF